MQCNVTSHSEITADTDIERGVLVLFNVCFDPVCWQQYGYGTQRDMVYTQSNENGVHKLIVQQEVTSELQIFTYLYLPK